MNYYKMLKASAFTLLALSLWSCTKEVDYTPAAPETGAQVFFARENATSFDLTENQNTVDVTVNRINTSGSLTVNVASSASVGGEATSIFSVPSTVSFTDGSATAQIPVTFDFNEIKSETNYTVVLTLEGEGLSEYGKTTQEVTIIYAPWSDWSLMESGGTYNNATPWGGIYDASPLYVRNSLLNPNMVQYNLYGFWMDDTDFLVNVDLSNNIVTVPVQSTGSKSGDYVIEFCDSYTFFNEVASGSPDPYYGRSTFDPNAGLMTINMVFFTRQGGGSLGWWGADNFDYLQLPGYPNYEIAVSNAGSYIDEAGTEFTVLSVSKGTDVASYAIELLPGSLTEEEIEAKVDEIVANTETVLYYDNQDFYFPVVEENYYTCVTVSYGEDGEAHGHNSFTFYNELNGKDWNEGWKTLTTDCLFSDLFMSAAFGLDTPTQWFVEVQESIAEPGLYRIVKPYETVSDYYGMEVERGHYYIMIDATNPDAVMVEPSYNCIGYWVLSVAPGKLADNKITFPANSCGMYGGVDEEGNYVAMYPWAADAELLDLNYVEPQDPEPATAKKRPANISLQNNLKKASLLPYKGKKIERRPSLIREK